MDYCTHDNNVKNCFYCKVNHKKEKEEFLEKNENNELSAIFETVLAHMNLNTRKVTEFNDSKLDTLLKYKSLNNLNEVLPFDLKLKIRDL